MFKKYLSLLFFFLSLNKGYAFLSNTRIYSLSSAILSVIPYLLIIFVSLTTLYILQTKKIKKYKKSYLIFYTIIFCVSIVLSFTNFKKNYYTHNNLLKFRNMNYSPKPNATHISKLMNLSFEEFKSLVHQRLVILDRRFMRERLINLDQITADQYNSFKIVSLTSNQSYLYLESEIKLSFTDIWNNSNKNNSLEVLHSNNISKNDKLLFVCLSGWRSHLIAYKLYNEGYSSYYTTLLDHIVVSS
jgi:hypothetical protein